MADIRTAIEELWNGRDGLVAGDADALAVVTSAIDLLDRGEERVAEIDPVTREVTVNIWLKQAILLLFKLSAMETINVGPFEFADKIPLKRDFAAAGVRVVPGGSARWGSFLERGVTLMPSYVNIGARVGTQTLVDTWATVGSCAQIGANVHLSGGVGIGGVLEPPGAVPVIVEDDCFIGSRCMIVDGARVRRGAKLGAGVILSGSIPVVDAETGEEVGRGDIPERAVVVQATRSKSFAGGDFGLACALIIRRLDEGEQHDKLLLERVLREHGLSSG
ncbi:MAG TPA: 2,3,4,5-tetrahydropyridine-2,6-dicarboxylate N-succinyltransferase [Acidimicrobiales bacterium]|nr:2,3,4,5-tetrahydropyridine-2,6-dicarboxylate N-succinyltransferase [Acidimicrobiales bacterium]